MHHLSRTNQDAGELQPTPASFMQPYGCSVALSTLKDMKRFAVTLSAISSLKYPTLRFNLMFL